MNKYLNVLCISLCICVVSVNCALATNVYNSHGRKIGSYTTKGNRTTYKGANGQRTGYSVQRNGKTYHYGNNGQLLYKAKI